MNPDSVNFAKKYYKSIFDANIRNSQFVKTAQTKADQINAEILSLQQTINNLQVQLNYSNYQLQVANLNKLNITNPFYYNQFLQSNISILKHIQTTKYSIHQKQLILKSIQNTKKTHAHNHPKQIPFDVLLVYGFIRSCNVNIPSELFNICYIFYSSPIRIFISESNAQFKLIDIKTNKISSIIPFRALSNYKLNSKSWCYIPNISSYIKIYHDDMNINKSYDGIFGTHLKKSNKLFARILFFESQNIENKIIKYHSFTSSNCFNDYNDCNFIFCDREYGIICQNKSILYQIDVKNINMKSKHFDCIKLTQTKPSFFKSSEFDLFTPAYDLSMHYLLNEAKIFAVDSNVTAENEAKCGIFDLNRNEWINISNFSYPNIVQSMQFSLFRSQVGICKNTHKYDKNVIYTVNTHKNTNQYHFKKDKWINLYQNLDTYQNIWDIKPIIWLDPNPFVLFCGYNTENKECFEYLDIRQNTRKWSKFSEYNCVSVVLQNYKNLFC